MMILERNEDSPIVPVKVRLNATRSCVNPPGCNGGGGPAGGGEGGGGVGGGGEGGGGEGVVTEVVKAGAKVVAMAG